MDIEGISNGGSRGEGVVKVDTSPSCARGQEHPTILPFYRLIHSTCPRELFEGHDHLLGHRYLKGMKNIHILDPVSSEVVNYTRYTTSQL